MNATYPTPTYVIPSGQSHQIPIHKMQNPSPSDSTSPTPSNVSPTSPRLQNYLQHHASHQHRPIRELRKPLYVPAVLRPTEFSARPGPMTPPKSLHGSLDSLQGSELDRRIQVTDEQLEMAMGTDWLDDDDLPQVTGPPTRDHWKPDQASPTCDSPQCRSSFNLLTRRHHCRHCGHIFCAEHTSYNIPLNQEAKFHPSGIVSRACDTCHRQYQRWDTARSLHSRRRESDEGDETRSVGSQTHRRMISGADSKKPPEQVANSVPRDWAWSTF